MDDFETNYMPGHDLLGPIGTMSLGGRTRPMYRVPLISTSELRESGELRYLICGPALYGKILEVVFGHEQASAEMDVAGAEVSISRTGEGIHSRYEVTYVPKPVLRGWTWRAPLLAAMAGAAAAAGIAAILWSMS